MKKSFFFSGFFALILVSFAFVSETPQSPSSSIEAQELVCDTGLDNDLFCECEGTITVGNVTDCGPGLGLAWSVTISQNASSLTITSAGTYNFAVVPGDLYTITAYSSCNKNVAIPVTYDFCDSQGTENFTWGPFDPVPSSQSITAEANQCS